MHKDKCLFTESWLGHIGHHHHARARERCWFQQALPGLLCGNPDAQVRGKDQHFFSVSTVWLGRVGMHRCSHPSSGYHDFPAEAYPGSAMPQQHRSSTTFCLHFTSERYLDCLWCFCATRWVAKSQSYIVPVRYKPWLFFIHTDHSMSPLAKYQSCSFLMWSYLVGGSKNEAETLKTCQSVVSILLH